MLQGDVRTKVKIPGAGKNESRRDCASSYHGEAVQAPLFLHPGFMPVPQHTIILATWEADAGRIAV
jgi:hypothetical protein